MGLISRVSSRTYRKQRPKPKKNPIMVCVKDINQSDFVVAFAAFLKKSGKISVPKWADFAKTQTQKQLAPADDDWFYPNGFHCQTALHQGHRRCRPICRHLRRYRQPRLPTCHTRKGNGHIARYALQELEKMKLVEKAEKGRKLSKDGQRDMDRVAAQIAKA